MQKNKLTGEKRFSLLSGLLIILFTAAAAGCATMGVHQTAADYFTFLPSDSALYAHIPVNGNIDFITSLVSDSESAKKLLKKTESMYMSLSDTKKYCIIASGSYPAALYSMYFGISAKWRNCKEKIAGRTFTYYVNSDGLCISFLSAGIALISNDTLVPVFSAVRAQFVNNEQDISKPEKIIYPKSDNNHAVTFISTKPESFVYTLFNGLIEFALESVSGELIPNQQYGLSRIDAEFSLTDERAVRPAMVLFKLAAKAVSQNIPEMPVVIENLGGKKILMKNVLISTDKLKSLL